jgi:outer membrane lipoprotein-sorting protein
MARYPAGCDPGKNSTFLTSKQIANVINGTGLSRDSIEPCKIKILEEIFMKRTLSLLMALLICIAALSACGSNNTGNTGSNAGEAAFNLSDLSNPFIGEWQSEIPSANTTLTFNYKADGTFDYEMAGVPAEQGGKGIGGYVVYDGIMVTWLDFEGAAAYTFEVADNNTINVTELESGENGELVPGNTSPFTRVEGSTVNTTDVPFKISNDFIGKWQSEIPSADAVLIFDFKADGTFDFEMPGVPEDQGGKGIGCYIVYGDKQVSYLDFEGVASYSFKVADADTINVTELEPNENGELVPGSTAPFVRVK